MTADDLPPAVIPSPAARIYERLRTDILDGTFAPRAALKPQELANREGVSLAVVRESLLRLVGEGLADRSPNRGFTVPAADASRWQQIAEARALMEPVTLRLAVERGDLEWEARVRAAHHRLAGTPVHDPSEPTRSAEAWALAHHRFHRTLLEGAGNPVLLDTFERTWLASELTRRWSGLVVPERDAAEEHAAIEAAVLARDADLAASLLARHIRRTAVDLVAGADEAVSA